jgi:nondiscriminating aspartyl-tRNA synthetase
MERIWIAEVPQRVGEQVRVSGFVNVVRDQRRMQFIVLQDRTGKAQITREKTDDSLARTISSLTPGSAMSATGRVVAAPNVKLGGVELLLEEIDTLTLASAPLPIAPDSSLEKQIDWRYLSLREPDNQLIFAVQTTFEHAMRLFWREHGFMEIHSPKLMGTFSESGAEVFKVDYFRERKAYLAQSPQFYKQMAIAAGFERVFEVGPAFRAEPSFTARHETEFTSLDMEIAWIDSHLEVMHLEEQWLAYALRTVAAEHGSAIRERFGVEIRVPETPFPSIALEEARTILKQRGHDIGGKPDLDPEGERQICAFVKERYGHEFVWIVDYPASVRAFYHMRHADRPDLTKGFDLLWKGVEVTTGAQREHRYDRLVQQATERGLNLEPLQDYLNFFKFGCPPHGGAGIGLARLLMVMLERSSIREVTFVSRTPTRLTP